MDALTARGDTLEEFNGRMYPYLLTLPGLDESANSLDRLVELKPEVVLSDPTLPYANKEIVHAGLTVVVLASDSTADLLQSITIISRIVGAEPQGARMVALMEQSMSLATLRTSRLDLARRTATLYAEWFGDAATPGSLPAELVWLAGGRNVADGFLGSKNDISLRQIAAWNPEVIFTSQRGNPSLYFGQSELNSTSTGTAP